MATCKNCHHEFEPTKPWQEFCDGTCRWQWHYREKKRERALNELDRLRGYRPPQSEGAREIVAKMVRRA
jgi:hypothetical protein